MCGDRYIVQWKHLQIFPENKLEMHGWILWHDKADQVIILDLNVAIFGIKRVYGQVMWPDAMHYGLLQGFSFIFTLVVQYRLQADIYTWNIPSPYPL